MFVPKISIRQKKSETLHEFRQRLKEHLETSDIQIVEIEYDADSITYFKECCQYLRNVNTFPKNETKLCDWCEFKEYCQSDGEIDYMIF